MIISKKKKKSHLKKKTHIYRTFTARARTCGRAVDLPHVRLCGAASLLRIVHARVVAVVDAVCVCVCVCLSLCLCVFHKYIKIT